MSNTPEELQAMSRQIIARCWADADFKARLLKDPSGTLIAEGYPLPAGVNLKVVENTAEAPYLVIPPRPTDLSDDALDQVSGGWWGLCIPCL